MRQALLLYEKTKDEKTGLLYQAWNCEGESYWAEHEGAHSSQFWSRSIGWFLTAALDILYYLPKTHHLRGAREGFLPPQYLKTGQAGYEGLIIAFKNFSLDNGLFNDVAAFLGFQRSNILLNKNAFLPLYVLTDIWQNIGWGSIVYLAAFSGVDAQLYEAATIDGANRCQQMKNITIPSIVPTIWRCRFV